MPNDSAEEGLRGSVPPLSVEAKALGITRATKGTMIFPKEHWAAGLKTGNWEVVNGVIVEHLPEKRRQPRRTVVAGFAKSEQPTFKLALENDEAPVSATAVLDQKRKIARWLADTVGKDLKADNRTQLLALYLDGVNQAHKISSGRSTYDSPDAMSAARSVLANVMANLTLEEQRLFKSGPVEARIRRYGRDPATTIDRSRLPVLARKFNRFLQGDYQRDDHMRARFAPAVEGNRMSVDMVTGASVTTRLGAIYRTEYEWFGKPETISFMARIYLAEHDAEDMDWNTWGFDGMYHTSIIGGIWALNRRTRRVTSFIREQPSGAWDERATLAEFAGWRIGYGAASKYQPDDRLTLVTETTHSSWEEADRRLFGHTPSGGKYYPIRGVAYSKGNYGLDWVCHQTANAFSLRKWNLLPVTYPISWLPFGPYGNNGISTRRDLVGQIHKGCVPGVWCFYNVTPPYSIPDPVMVGVMESQMTGSGWGLETLWNPNKGWVRSEASFDPMAINCTVPASEVVAVERL